MPADWLDLLARGELLFSTNERFLKGDERRGLVDGGEEKREKEGKKFGRVGWRGRVKKKTEEEGE